MERFAGSAHVGRRYDDQFVRSGGERGEIAVERRPAAECEVDLPVCEPVPDARAVGHLQIDGDLRVVHAECCEEGRDEMLRGRRDDAQPQPARA